MTPRRDDRMSTGASATTSPPDELSNDLADWIADDLVAPGLLDPAGFEDAFVGVVRDVDPGWTTFYRNTLAALRGGGEPGGTNAGMAPVHDRAAALALGPHVVELGCCFGFLSLRLAAEGHRVTAVDLVPGTARLLASVAARARPPGHGPGRRRPAHPAGRPGAPTRSSRSTCSSTCPAVSTPQVLAEMLRVARRRAVVAVPFEDEPNAGLGPRPHLRPRRPARARRGDRPAVHRRRAPRRLAGHRLLTTSVRPSSATSTAPAAESTAAPSTVSSKPRSSSAGAAAGFASSAASVTPSAEPR